MYSSTIAYEIAMPGIYKPFMKENDTPIYVHCGSNHPPSVLRNIPLGVNNRLSRISSSKAVFDSAAPVYQEALNKSGYTHKLEFKPKEPNCTKRKIGNATLLGLTHPIPPL